MSKEVRVRFAPSPTGALHIGGVRTALYNYLYAKKHGGKFILRIEDTDQSRYVEGAEQYIMDSLKWVGITPDESPEIGGPFSPYRQSERKPMYMEYAQKLIDEGKAYYAFDTSEELNEMRERLKAARVASPQYNAITRETMKNSLTLPEDEVKSMLEAGEPYVIRLKVPRKEEVRLKDAVRGWVMVHSSAIDDKVLMKSDGMPTYHLANVVDDHLMKITHVIRGEEWLPSAPLHVLLYQYLGWEDTMPEFAHLPLILKPDGNGKLSKRAADKLGIPVFPLTCEVDDDKDPSKKVTAVGFKESGYLPEALVNFLAFLGWNPGTHEELFSMDELTEAFTLERIGKAGTKFDIDKARWFNQQYLKMKSNDEIGEMIQKVCKEHGEDITLEDAASVAGMMKERLTFPTEIWEEASYFFEDPDEYEEKVIKKKWNQQAVNVIEEYKEEIKSLDQPLTAILAKELLQKVLDRQEVGMGRILQALRVAVTGKGAGPDLMEIISFLGKERIVRRLELALDRLQDNVKA